MSELHPGSIIQTKGYGRAKVVKPIRTGYQVVLLDVNNFEVALNWSDLDLPERSTVPEAAVHAPPLVVAAGPERDSATTAGESAVTIVIDRALSGLTQRKSIEALRFGLVPSHSLEALTLGYDELRDWICSYFPDGDEGRPCAAEVVGPFGTGKSHAMSVVRHLAREAGYLTARVEVDGVNISLSDPAKLMYSLWSTLSGRSFESTTPLFDLFLRAIEDGNPEPQMLVSNMGVLSDQVSDLYATIKGLYRIGQTDVYRAEFDALLSSSPEFTATELKNLLRGEHRLYNSERRIKPMVTTANQRHPHDFALALAGVARIARLAGFTGLVVTIDEFEVEHKHLTTQRVMKVKRVMEFLADYIAGNSNIREAPLGIFIATLGDDGLVTDLIDNTDGGVHQLTPWRPEDRILLAERIHQLYIEAYGIGADFDVALAQWAEQEASDAGYSDSGQLRAFIKLYISKLDSIYGPPAVGV